jgi:hypothetical protein
MNEADSLPATVATAATTTGSDPLRVIIIGRQALSSILNNNNLPLAVDAVVVPVTEDEEAVTPPLPRAPTDHVCGHCSAQLPGLPPTCLECGHKIYHQCMYCAKPDPAPVCCHYASRHPLNKGTILCTGCSLVCEECNVDVCADCGRTCSQCEEFICWGCSGVEGPSHIGDICPKCETKNGKRQKTQQDAGAEAVEGSQAAE